MQLKVFNFARSISQDFIDIIESPTYSLTRSKKLHHSQSLSVANNQYGNANNYRNMCKNGVLNKKNYHIARNSNNKSVCHRNKSCRQQQYQQKQLQQKQCQQQKQEQQQLQHDIPQFIDYILNKHKQTQQLSTTLQQLHDDILTKQQKVINAQQTLYKLTQQNKQLVQQCNLTIQQINTQCTNIQKSINQMQDKTHELSQQLVEYHHHKFSIQELQNSIAAKQLEIGKYKLECDRALAKIKQERIPIYQQISGYQNKMNESTYVRNKIAQLKQQTGILKKINISTSIVQYSLQKQANKLYNPAKYNLESIQQLKIKLRTKMQQLATAINQCQETSKFHKKINALDLTNTHDDNINTHGQLALTENQQYSYKLYEEYFKTDKNVQQMTINLSRQLDKFADVRAEKQLNEVRLKNTQVLFYMKKLETEITKKQTIINNLRIQVSDLQREKTANESIADNTVRDKKMDTK